MREKLATRLGFLLVSAGCAIGLGNVWRFPYVAGKSGGGWFVLVYLVCLAALGLPILVMEFAAGRGARHSLARLHATLTPQRRAWRAHGVLGFVGVVTLMSFYTVVTGWMLLYFLKSAAGDFAGLDAAGASDAFADMLAHPLPMALAMLAVSATSSLVSALGLQRGIERIVKVMMLLMLAMIVVLAVHSVMLEGAGEGVRFYLVPDFARVRAVGPVTVVVEAMNHSFFTLSLGIGAMAVFGSYVGRERTLLGEATSVALLDTFVALMAGLVVIPACFACHVEPGQGPGLVFVTLPQVFGQMALGRFWGSFFFAFMGIAALTTVLAGFECILASVMESLHWSRLRASVVAGVAVPLLSLPCVLGFNVWSSFQPMGPGSCVMDLEDFVVSNLLLPLGGLAFALYCTRRYGWGWERFVAEANAGAGLKIPGGKWLRLYCAWGLPAVVLLVFVLGLVEKLRG